MSVWDSHCNESSFQSKSFGSASKIQKKSDGFGMKKIKEAIDPAMLYSGAHFYLLDIYLCK